jgi:beta-phosphoglucomutase-like phosphatase (HAD superfamily)
MQVLHVDGRCTSSFKESCSAVLAGTGLDEFFGEDHRICLDDVSMAKPDPEPYLRAAATIGLPASECVALEDSASGVQAAVAAGYGLVIGVLTTSAEETLRSAGAHLTFPNTTAAVEMLLSCGVDRSAAQLKSTMVAKL